MIIWTQVRLIPISELNIKQVDVVKWKAFLFLLWCFIFNGKSLLLNLYVLSGLIFSAIV